MQIFRQTPVDYVRFGRTILILTAAVGVVRLALSLAGAPAGITAWFSLNAVTLLAVVYFPIRVHTSGFGGYRHVLALLVIQVMLAQLIVGAGIVFTAVTGIENAFSAPEFSGGAGTNQWFHAAGHVVSAPIFAVVVWLPASVILFLTQKIVRKPADSGVAGSTAS